MTVAEVKSMNGVWRLLVTGIVLGTTDDDFASGRFYWQLVFDRHQDWTRADGQ